IIVEVSRIKIRLSVHHSSRETLVDSACRGVVDLDDRVRSVDIGIPSGYRAIFCCKDEAGRLVGRDLEAQCVVEHLACRGGSPGSVRSGNREYERSVGRWRLWPARGIIEGADARSSVRLSEGACI